MSANYIKLLAILATKTLDPILKGESGTKNFWHWWSQLDAIKFK